MSASWFLDGAAIVMAAIGAILGPLAIFADRPRGRRRCPRCWYELGPGMGLVCPECGRAARREGALGRTRRHWRIATLAVLMLAAAASAFVVPRVRRDGWWSVAPTTALILMCEEIESGDGWRQDARDELLERLGINATGPLAPSPGSTLWGWQWRLMLGPIIRPEHERRSWLDGMIIMRALLTDALERAGYALDAQAALAEATLRAPPHEYGEVAGSYWLCAVAAHPVLHDVLLVRVASATAGGKPVTLSAAHTVMPDGVVSHMFWFTFGASSEPVTLVAELEIGVITRDGFRPLGRTTFEQTIQPAE